MGKGTGSSTKVEVEQYVYVKMGWRRADEASSVESEKQKKW